MAFKLSLKLKRCHGNDEQQVFYKIDGQRFKNERTLKLSSSTEYEIELTIKPRHEISSMAIQGTDVSLTKVLTRNNDDVADIVDKNAYTGSWNTIGMPPKKDGERYQMPVTIQIPEIGEFVTHLQCKLYRESDTEHVTWGQPLHWIEFDCQKLSDRSFIDIFKESYR
ncbi:CB1 cannabinoid receptor-interacting protein 1-like [Tubulanus polymorphus]|uniref:CB1 cannabinoid receptor-interacting protein 1-like n=1 Tax=Tubulanus polymorphus TaxID=672921 RepID=UPI003DA4D4C5